MKMDSGGTRVGRIGDGGHSVEAGYCGTRPWRRLRELEQKQDKELLPGIPDDITLDYIVTKLPWRTFYTLSIVNPTWRKAIQSRRIYDARVRFSATDTLVVHIHDQKGKIDERIAVYSMRDKCCYELPPIPQICRGIPGSRQCASVDGKVYVFGGGYDYYTDERINLVYMLDLAGQRRWKQCASMQWSRQKFAIGIVDRKIYALGGVDYLHGPVDGSEVYDPEANTWTPITPMISLRFGHQVVTVGKELFVHGGGSYDRAYPGWQASQYENLTHDSYLTEFLFFQEWLTNPDEMPAAFFLGSYSYTYYNYTPTESLWKFIGRAPSLEIYDSVEDEWRTANTFRSPYDLGAVFVVQGQLHSLDECGIYVHGGKNNAWKELHSWDLWSESSPGLGEDECPSFGVVLVVNGELFVGGYWYSDDNLSIRNGPCFLHSSGFGGGKKEITWQFLSNCNGNFKKDMHITQL